jgi:hypothetical protein
MSTRAVEQLRYLLDEAFAGQNWHSLLANLRAITPGEWGWVPPGGHRPIREIVRHVGGTRLVYENHAFGDARLRWDDPTVLGGDALGDPPSAIAWLRAGHERLRRRVAALDDAALARLRPTTWGASRETRWIIMILIQHDIYHAGEINHLRAVCRRDDRWAFDTGA